MEIERMVVYMHDRVELEVNIRGGATFMSITPEISREITLSIEQDALVLEFQTVDDKTYKYVVGDLRDLR